MGTGQFTYRTLDQAWKTKFLPDQNDASCLAVRDASKLTQFLVGGLTLKNRSGAPSTVGLAGRLPQSLWKAGQCDNLNAYTEDTTDAQAGVADGFLLGSAGVAQSGIIVLCRIPFNLLSVIVTTVATGGTTFDLAYSIAGNVWKTIVNPTDVPDWTGNGERMVHFPQPGNDWIVVTAGHGAGLPVDGSGWYGLRIRELAGNVACGKASQLVLGVSREVQDKVNDQGVVTDQPGIGEIEFPPQCDGLAAIFGNPNDQNVARVRYRTRG